MTEEARNLINEAMRLGVADRARIAASILASLDGEPEEGVEEAWAKEIQERLELIRSGKANARPWSEVRDDLHRRSG